MAAMASGCLSYLTKPFTAQSLIEPIDGRQPPPRRSAGSSSVSFVDLLLKDLRRGALADGCEFFQRQRCGDGEQVGVDDFHHEILARFHLAEQRRTGGVASDAGIGQAPGEGNLVRSPLVHGKLDAGRHVEPDRQKQLQPCVAVAFALGQVDAHCRLTGLKRAADRGAAYHLCAARLEAELLPVSIFDAAGLALAAGGEFVRRGFCGLLRKRPLNWRQGECECRMVPHLCSSRKAPTSGDQIDTASAVSTKKCPSLPCGGNKWYSALPPAAVKAACIRFDSS